MVTHWEHAETVRMYVMNEEWVYVHGLVDGQEVARKGFRSDNQALEALTMMGEECAKCASWIGHLPQHSGIGDCRLASSSSRCARLHRPVWTKESERAGEQRLTNPIQHSRGPRTQLALGSPRPRESLGLARVFDNVTETLTDIGKALVLVQAGLLA